MLLCALREWDRRLDFICAKEGKKSGEKEKKIVFDEPSKVLSFIMKCVEAKGWFFKEYHENWDDYIKVFLPIDHPLNESVLRYIRFEVKGEYEGTEVIRYKILMHLSGRKQGAISRLKKDASRKKCLEKIEGLFNKLEEWKHPESAGKDSIAPADHDVPVALEAK
jgi:hypothetical protein